MTDRQSQQPLGQSSTVPRAGWVRLNIAGLLDRPRTLERKFGSEWHRSVSGGVLVV